MNFLFTSVPLPPPPPPHPSSFTEAFCFATAVSGECHHPMLALLSFLLVSLMLLGVLYFAVKWQQHHPEYKRLPPGSMGWPYFGETKELFTKNPSTFFSERQKRYGNIYKTYILGCPCIMVASPEAAKAVLVTQANLFKPTYPRSKENMIGPEAIFFNSGTYHAKLKKLVQANFLPAAIKGFVPDIEAIVLKILPTWKNKKIITLKEMKMYAFDVAMMSIFGDPELLEMEKIKKLYLILEQGYNSMPLDIPGTPYHRSMKARKLLNEKLRQLIKKTKEGDMEKKGLLGLFLDASFTGGEQLTDSQIADNIIGVIFAAHDTTASVLTWVFKFLHDNGETLAAVTREQEEIRMKMIKENRGLTWEDTKHMPVTSTVIQETLRASSVLSFTYREAVQDVEFEGYLIPKGWKVLPIFRSIHHSAEFFPNPEKFEPSRFDVAPKPNTYMPFGTGVHSCPGNEMAKLEMYIMLHYLTISCRWEVIAADDGIQYVPFPVPKDGLPIKVIPRDAMGVI